MGRSADYKSGIKEGVRFAITWLHARAYSMNDPKARQILNSAAFSLGVELNKSNLVQHRIDGEHERARVGRDWSNSAPPEPDP